MPINFQISLIETDGKVAFTCDSPAAPEATDAEIQYAKALQTMLAVFKDRLTADTKKVRNLKFQKRYPSQPEPPPSPATN